MNSTQTSILIVFIIYDRRGSARTRRKCLNIADCFEILQSAITENNQKTDRSFFGNGPSLSA